MIRKFSIIGFVLTVGVIALTVWSKSQAVTILDDNHPEPRGELSRMDYMNQVCHVFTADFMVSNIYKNGYEVDKYCNCFAIKSVQLLYPNDDHGYALSYHTNYVIGQRDFDAGIDSQTEIKLPFESVRSLRKAYKKTYGLSLREQLVYSEKSMDVTQTCILSLTSKQTR